MTLLCELRTDELADPSAVEDLKRRASTVVVEWRLATSNSVRPSASRGPSSSGDPARACSDVYTPRPPGCTPTSRKPAHLQARCRSVPPSKKRPANAGLFFAPEPKDLEKSAARARRFPGPFARRQPTTPLERGPCFTVALRGLTSF